jgi:hypothetical protein
MEVVVDAQVEVDGTIQVEGDLVARVRHEHLEALQRHREDLDR